jgi:hypothetical protein
MVHTTHDVGHVSGRSDNGSGYSQARYVAVAEVAGKAVFTPPAAPLCATLRRSGWRVRATFPWLHRA